MASVGKGKVILIFIMNLLINLPAESGLKIWLGYIFGSSVCIVV